MPRRAIGGACVIAPMSLARQAEMRMSASGGAEKNAWEPEQLELLHRRRSRDGRGAGGSTARVRGGCVRGPT